MDDCAIIMEICDMRSAILDIPMARQSGKAI